MRTTRKILSVLLAVIMVLSIVPMAGVTSFAATSGDYEYEVLSETDKTCEITGYTGSAANLTIPATLNGYKVTSIGVYAFRDCTSLASVTIPDSIEIIDNLAFADCENLSEINMPDKPVYIKNETPDLFPSGAFCNTKVYENPENWENGVCYIGKCAYESDAEGDLRFREGTLAISDGWFSTRGQNVYIPSSVTLIGEYCVFFIYDEEIGEYNYDVKPTIYGHTGSYAEQWAKEHKYPFVSVDGVANVSMYRLYNPNSGEHFYTADVNEKNNLVSVGWKYEGIGWTAPATSDKPVYRLYNQNGGEHHYTLDASERDFLVSLGWKFEDIGWYSADTNGIPLYRQYNPNAFANNHNYTADKSENDWLVGLGWKAEGIGWYGVA